MVKLVSAFVIGAAAIGTVAASTGFAGAAGTSTVETLLAATSSVWDFIFAFLCETARLINTNAFTISRIINPIKSQFGPCDSGSSCGIGGSVGGGFFGW